MIVKILITLVVIWLFIGWWFSEPPGPGSHRK